jgi:ATPase subunit of ABC transporter with duplicated ATPase domains
LACFSGAVLLVSHDRRLIKEVATDILQLSAGQLVPGADMLASGGGS